MSCSIVEPETIERIINGIAFSAHTRQLNAWHGITDDTSIDAGMMNASDEYRAAFAAKLDAMNCAAYGTRYADAVEPEMPHLSLGFPPSPIQFLKSLQCFLYQCAEGDLMQSTLYIDLRKIAQSIAMNIVQASAEYQSAEWG